MCSAGLHAWFLIGQGHRGIFFLVKGTLWGNCKCLFHGHQSNDDQGARRQSPSLSSWSSRPGQCLNLVIHIVISTLIQELHFKPSQKNKCSVYQLGMCAVHGPNFVKSVFVCPHCQPPELVFCWYARSVAHSSVNDSIDFVINLIDKDSQGRRKMSSQL